jgi:hypothetical protein
MGFADIAAALSVRWSVMGVTRFLTLNPFVFLEHFQLIQMCY